MTREEAVFYIKELQKTYASMDKKVAEAVDMAIEALSAERTGKWVYIRIFKTENDIAELRCSECGKIASFEQGEDMNFCPSCGADMRGEGND